MEIFALVAPAKQMFFKGTMLCSGIFKQGQYYTFFFLFFFFRQSGREGTVLWLPPSSTPVRYKRSSVIRSHHLLLYSPWDEKRTKTDKFECSLQSSCQSKMKRSSAFNLSVVPRSSFFSYAFQKLPWSGTRLPALLGGRLLVPNQVFISPLFSSPLLHTSVGLIQRVPKGLIKKKKRNCRHSTPLSHPENTKWFKDSHCCHVCLLTCLII